MCFDSMGEDLGVVPVEQIHALPGMFFTSIEDFSHIDLGFELCTVLFVPFEPFDSGVDFIEQPEDTSLQADSLLASDSDWRRYDGLGFDLGIDQQDASTYIGGRHNPLDRLTLKFSRIKGARFSVKGEAIIDFEYEGVGQADARVQLETELQYLGFACRRTLLKSICNQRQQDPRTVLESTLNLDAFTSFDELRSPHEALRLYDPENWHFLEPVLG